MTVDVIVVVITIVIIVGSVVEDVHRVVCDLFVDFKQRVEIVGISQHPQTRRNDKTHEQTALSQRHQQVERAIQRFSRDYEVRNLIAETQVAENGHK